MANESRPQMPLDWDDHAGWDTYYAEIRAADAHLKKALSDLFDATMFLEHIGQKQYQTLWFPGCGISLAPHVYGALGFDVWASDASTRAIAIQEEWLGLPWQEHVDLAELRERLPETRLAGAVHLQAHDFRTAFDGLVVDCILNMRSFQGLPPQSMKSAAHVHWNALRPGGTAFFSTMNVQGELRDTFEDALIEAGFLVPFHETETWRRQKLKETGIPHVFILGNPMIYRGDERYQSPEGKAQAERDQERLKAFQGEYRARLEAEHERQAATLQAKTDVKIAHVIYNTG